MKIEPARLIPPPSGCQQEQEAGATGALSKCPAETTGQAHKATEIQPEIRQAKVGPGSAAHPRGASTAVPSTCAHSDMSVSLRTSAPCASSPAPSILLLGKVCASLEGCLNVPSPAPGDSLYFLLLEGDNSGPPACALPGGPGQRSLLPLSHHTVLLTNCPLGQMVTPWDQGQCKALITLLKTSRGGLAALGPHWRPEKPPQFA